MIKFKEYFINEAGEAAGKMELVKTDVKKAREYAEKAFEKEGEDLDKGIPDFEKNYEVAKKAASGGTTKRKDMPVIDEKDVKNLQRRLVKGYIDISAPFAPETDKKNPFPTGLQGNDAKNFLEDGLEIHDGDKNDDKVKANLKKIAVGDLKPIQKQIYFDKSITATAEFGPKGTKKFLTSASTFIVSSDNHIIDGHHRFLSGLLIDPKMQVQCLVVDLPISKFLPLALAYGDAVGNKRNK